MLKVPERNNSKHFLTLICPQFNRGLYSNFVRVVPRYFNVTYSVAQQSLKKLDRLTYERFLKLRI
jgi:hypothetical protein